MSENILNPNNLNPLTTTTNETKEDKRFRTKAGIFLASVAGMSAMIGFGTTLASAKKADPKYFNKGVVPTLEMRETGAMLALRALGWGTFYAFTGCGILFYGIWKLSGAQDLKDFRYKIGSVLPTIPKNHPPQGRTEFEGLNDLMGYLSTLKGDKDKKN